MSLLRLLSKAQALLLPNELNISYPLSPTTSCLRLQSWNPDQPGTPDSLPPLTQVTRTAQPPSAATPLSDERRPVSNPPLIPPSTVAHQVVQSDPSATIDLRQSRTGSNNYFINSSGFIIENMTACSDFPKDEWRSVQEERRVREESRAERQRQAEEERRTEEILQKLIEKGMPSAMPDADEYAPKTDPGTRKTLRDTIVKWGRDPKEIQCLFWLSGPAAIGKSAIAQSVTDKLAEMGLLGAAFFFSRTKHRSDPRVIIPTLVYQLARLLPEYKRLVGQRLAKNPSIFDSTRRSQFKDLITEPFKELASKNELTVQQPLVIVLDGLDECSDRGAQVEFVDIICSYALEESGSRLRWIICSRPEPEINAAFSKEKFKEKFKSICHQLKLDVHDNEAQSDTEIILNNGFKDIRERYPDQLSQDWPTKDQVRLIAKRALGHHGFASFIVRFIGDRKYNKPSHQLNVCLGFLERTAGFAGTNPLHSLDLLYTQVFLDTPKEDLATTRRILGLLILYGDHKHLTVAALANFLDLDQPTFYSALQRLYSVLIIPRPHEASTRCLRVYHASFSDYLTEQARSAEFWLDEGVVPYLNIAVSGLKWLGHARKHASDHELSQLTWTPPGTDPNTVLASLCRYSFTRCWKACVQVPKGSVPKLIEKLEDFDFRLDYEYWWPNQTHEFAYFIRWLASLKLGICRKHLISVQQQETDDHVPNLKLQAAIYHSETDPSTFVEPFLRSVPKAEAYRIRFLLSTGSGTNHFWLVIGGLCEFYEGQDRALGKLAEADKAAAEEAARRGGVFQPSGFSQGRGMWRGSTLSMSLGRGRGSTALSFRGSG